MRRPFAVLPANRPQRTLQQDEAYNLAIRRPSLSKAKRLSASTLMPIVSSGCLTPTDLDLVCLKEGNHLLPCRSGPASAYH